VIKTGRAVTVVAGLGGAPSRDFNLFSSEVGVAPEELVRYDAKTAHS